jgi:hypothetical protein
MALRIGEMLIEKGLLTQEKLDLALLEQGKTGKFLGEILVQMGFVHEEDLLKSLAQQFNTHYVKLDQVQINPVAVKAVPVDLVAEFKFMPIEMRNAVMLIAVSNPLDMWPMSALQKQLNLSDVQIVLARKDDILQTIRKYYA